MNGTHDRVWTMNAIGNGGMIEDIEKRLGISGGMKRPQF